MAVTFNTALLIKCNLCCVAPFLQVCDQDLSLPNNVTISKATVSAGHLSSASIYPACLAPYLISTACSDRKVRFWSCAPDPDMKNKFVWAEWDMVANEDYTAIDMPGSSIHLYDMIMTM